MAMSVWSQGDVNGVMFTQLCWILAPKGRRRTVCPITLQKRTQVVREKQEYLESARTRKRLWRSLGVLSLAENEDTYTIGDFHQDGETFPYLDGRRDTMQLWYNMAWPPCRLYNVTHPPPYLFSIFVIRMEKCWEAVCILLNIKNAEENLKSQWVCFDKSLTDVPEIGFLVEPVGSVGLTYWGTIR